MKKLEEDKEVLKITKIIFTASNIIIMSPFTNSQDLRKFFKTKSVLINQKRNIFFKIVLAVQKCHRKSIAHRDIKLDNIVISPCNFIQLIDL